MRVRKVDANGDMVFGRGQADFWRDAPDGVGQVVESRLHLWQGDWYLDRSEGTPFQYQVLGKRTEFSRDPALRARILGSPGVTQISAYNSDLNRSTRALAVTATIETVYSRAAVGGAASTTTVLTSVFQDR